MNDRYAIDDVGDILTPALLVYPEVIDANIAVTLRLLDGRADRWRPHVKTAKLPFTMQRLVDRGVSCFKCATTLELATACEAGASDVLVAYPVVGANARRVVELASATSARVSALVEDDKQLGPWQQSGVGLFVDINPGMDRTGIGQEREDAIVSLVGTMTERGVTFRGLHYYDGHLRSPDRDEREAAAHRGYDRLFEIVAAVEGAGFEIEEVITAGTPSLPASLSYGPFESASFAHRVSPGTIVYNDLCSLSQLPPDYGYRPAALVLSTVVSHPAASLVTCDAGHKAVSADEGVPTCAVLDRDDLVPGHPSEEHLPIEVAHGSQPPELGASLYLVPRHVCPTVNNFDHAVIVSQGRIRGVEPVSARGREAPYSGSGSSSIR
jgi:D-serine deaminase-like pyridoxal phosphate-dependent protein